MDYYELPVSKEYRNKLDSIWGITRDTAIPLRIAHYLARSPVMDRDTGRVVLPHELVKSFRPTKGKTKNFSAEAQVMRCERFFGFDYYSAIPRRKYATIIPHLPSWFQEITDKMARGDPSDLTLDLYTGLEVDLAERLTRRRDAAISRSSGSPLESKSVLSYLNHLPSSLFESVRHRVPEALEELNRDATPGSPPLQSAWSVNATKAALNAIQVDPQPMYATGQMSPRVSPVGYSFLNVKSSVRDKLTAEWTKIDIVHCHLEIVAALWRIPSLSKLMQTGEFWEQMAHQIGAPLSASKKALKTATYSTVYGASKANIRAELAASLSGLVDSPDESAERFLNSPIIRDLLCQRNQELTRLAAGGVTIDAFQRPLTIRDCTASQNKRDQARTILACAAQSYELRLMSKSIEYVKRIHAEDFPIYVAAWAHDGGWLAGENLDYHARQIEAEIKAESLQLLGSEVSLKIEHPLSPRIYVA